MMGAFCENGPYNIQNDGTIVPNEYSWNRYANLLYRNQRFHLTTLVTSINRSVPDFLTQMIQMLFQQPKKKWYVVSLKLRSKIEIGCRHLRSIAIVLC
jgi:hypothetical protein